MVGGVSGIGSVYYNPYIHYGQRAGGASQTRDAQSASPAVLTAKRGASPETPVQPVRPAAAVSDKTANPVGLGLPIRQGADPVEMAVRMRIQYAEPESGPVDAKETAPLMEQGKAAEFPPLPGQGGREDKAEGAAGIEDVQEAMEKGECQTCKERKYQDGSDDPGVSFKTPTNIDPSQAANAVRGHEMEHVTREQAKAQREDRKVVSQNVTYHTAICPECGRVYVSGGTTRTVTAANNDPAQQEAQEDKKERQAFSIMA